MSKQSRTARLFAGLILLALPIIGAPTPGKALIEPRRCGVLDGPGCNPNQCGVLDGPGCQAQAQVGGFGENLQLTLGTRAAADAKKPDGALNNLRDLFTMLRACWAPPALENAVRGTQLSIRFSLNRDGKLIGPPRVTYATHDVPPKTRDVYRDAITQSLQGCMPFAFSKGFAGAIAGRPIAIRIIENRDDAPAKPRA